MHPKFGQTGVQTHDLQIMDSIFHIPEMLVLTTEPSPTTQNHEEDWWLSTITRLTGSVVSDCLDLVICDHRKEYDVITPNILSETRCG